MYSDYRQYLEPLLPLIRFPLMKHRYFASKVQPLEMLPRSTVTSLSQLFSGPPFIFTDVDQSNEKNTHSQPNAKIPSVCIAKRRNAQTLIISKCEEKGSVLLQDFEVPNPLPIVVNNGHSTFLEGSLAGGKSAI